MNTLEILLSRRWILKAQDREMEKVSDGKAGVSGHSQSVPGQSGKDSCQSAAVDGDC